MTEETGATGELPVEKNVFDSLTTGEKVLGGAAAWLFIVDYVIGNRLTDSWLGSVAVWVAMLSLAIVLSMYFYHFGKEAAWHPFYPWLARVAAWGIVVLAVLDLLNGLLNQFGSSGRFYEITFYLAAAAVGAGAWMVRQEWSST
jgi:hypothetical protein